METDLAVNSQPSPSRHLVTVSLLTYVAVLGTCKILYLLKGSVPLVASYFELVVLILWIYVPTLFIILQRYSFEEYGITLGLEGNEPIYPRAGPVDDSKAAVELNNVDQPAPPRVSDDTGPSILGILGNIWAKWARVTLLALILIIPVFIGGYYIYAAVWFHRGVDWAFHAGWGQMAFIQVMLIGFPEEFFFRGFLQSHLNKYFQKPIVLFGRPLMLLGVPIRWSLLITSFLFACGHPLIEGGIRRMAVFFPSLIFGWLREKTGTIVSSSIFHAVCNITIFSLEGGY
jgi:membrane protease YdiL (CAAX protease family)